MIFINLADFLLKEQVAVLFVPRPIILNFGVWLRETRGGERMREGGIGGRGERRGGMDM